MSKGIRALAIAACMLAVVCGVSWAEDHQADIDHKVYEDHYTISELTSNYKTSYASPSTRFGGFNLHIRTPYGHKLAAGDEFTVTPNGAAYIGYVKSGDFFGKKGNIEDHLCFKMPYLRQTDLISTVTESSPITHKLVAYEYDDGAGNINTDVMPLNNAGNIPIFGALGNAATEGALSEAAYVLKLGSDTYSGKLGKVVTTSEQVSNMAVPYVELNVDASGKVQSVTWRGVKASDPSTPVEYTNSNDQSMGMFRVAFLKPHIYLKDGSLVWSNNKAGNMVGSPTPGQDLEMTLSAPFHKESDSSKQYDLRIDEIATVQIENDNNFQWLFFPNQSGIGGVSPDIPPVVSPDTPPYIPPSGTPGGIPSISNGDVSHTAPPGVTGAACIGARRPDPPGFGRPSMSDPSNVGTITIINTILLMVNYDTNTLPPGATVTFTINNFSYRPKGKLFACAKHKTSGAWDRFPITSTANSISFSLPVLAYFSTSDVVIADIETSDTDTGGEGSSGGGGCAIGVGIAALAALAIVKRRTR